MMRIIRLLPTAALSMLVGLIARVRYPRWFKNLLINIFIRMYRIQTDEVERPSTSYPSLAAFFIRRLKPEARPQDDDPSAIISPVDARWVGSGDIDESTVLIVKHQPYTVADLIGNAAAAAGFKGGTWAVLHLRPFDYHRIHVPLAGKVSGHAWIPGRLLPVKESALQSCGPVFLINRRRITMLESMHGPYALIKVGALNVGRIPVEYPIPEGSGFQPCEGPWMERGSEIARFELGSTVVLLFPAETVSLCSIEPDTDIRCGQKIGRIENI